MREEGVLYMGKIGQPYKKEEVVSRQPTTFIVNLKSNTMKNTVQIYGVYVLQHAFSM
jgi:hypothetical protein